MGKRLQRYFFNEFSANLPGLRGKSATFVLTNGGALLGTIRKQEGQLLFIEDKIPRLHRIEIKNIYEIVVDSESNY